MLRTTYEYLLRWNGQLGRWTARAIRRSEDRLTWVSAGYSSVGAPPWVARRPGWEEAVAPPDRCDDGTTYGRARVGGPADAGGDDA